MDFTEEAEPVKVKATASKTKASAKKKVVDEVEFNAEIITVTNMSKKNIFTEIGRVMPGQSTQLPRSIAALYTNLKEG